MIFIVLILFVVLFATLAYVSSPQFKGKLGEHIVSQQAKRHLGADYTVLNNCTFAVEANEAKQRDTTQIDHIILSPFGIFVIETKNYKGWIFGGEQQKMWTQKVFKKSFKFQNPLHQNYKHIKILENILTGMIFPEDLHSIVVFTGESAFKTQMPHNVFQGKAWTQYVKSYTTQVISPMTLKRIQLKLEKIVLEDSYQTHQAHIKNLRERHQNKN